MRNRPLVLIVDDATDIRELYAVILSPQYRIAEAPDGRRGLEQVAALRPDLVLLDGMMPGMDGLEFLLCLNDAAPVVMISGFDGMEGPALAAGVCAFLRKPVTVADLCAAVANVLARRQVDTTAAARRTDEERARAAAQRQAVLEAVPLADTQLAADLRAVTDWLVRYFGFGVAWVNLQPRSTIRVQAISGSGKVPAGAEVPPRETFCTQVISGGSPLLLANAATHPGFVDYPEACAADPFYAGVPLRVPGGPVLGTLCLTDDLPHEFGPEDMLLLAYFAERIAAHLTALGERRRPELTLLETPRLVHRDTLLRVLGYASARQAPAVAAVVLHDGEGVQLETLAFAAQEAAGEPRSVAAAFAPDALVMAFETPGLVEESCRALLRLFGDLGIATSSLCDVSPAAIDAGLRRLVASARRQKAPRPTLGLAR
jgi:CheY-like chemotaxis protein